MLKAVIFDMDGVIVDTEPGYFHAINDFLAHFGKSIDKKFNERLFGVSSKYAWKQIIEHTGLTDLTAQQGVEGMENEREKRLKKEGYQPIDGTIALIKSLSEKKIPIAVASSSPIKEIDRVMDVLNLRSYFQSIVSGSDECKNAKPFPDVFLKAAQKLGVDPKHCLVIEDSDNGALAAKRAGMKVIGYQNQEYGNQKLKDADYVVTDMKDVTYDLCKKVRDADEI
ncbi:HAD family hydrolase [Anaerostipes sp.]|uniref:HAD family hydrolase n=1 Tax=Anaerostipes sp. TaxID=1872530 RepID=UPI003FEF54DC